MSFRSRPDRITATGIQTTTATAVKHTRGSETAVFAVAHSLLWRGPFDVQAHNPLKDVGRSRCAIVLLLYMLRPAQLLQSGKHDWTRSNEIPADEIRGGVDDRPD